MTTERRAPLTILLLASLLLTGCTASGARPTPTASRPPVPVPAGDGVLRIATVLDLSPAGAAVAAVETAGVELAAREITEQGGVRGAAVLTLHRPASTDPAALGAELASRGVDIVLWGGPGDVPEALAAAIDDAHGAVLPLAVGDPAAAFAPDDAFTARLRSADPGISTAAGGAEAYDATVSLALAATVAGNDTGAAVAAALPRVSAGPVECTSWGACSADLAAGQGIRYRGVTGGTGLGAADPSAPSTEAPAASPVFGVRTRSHA